METVTVTLPDGSTRSYATPHAVWPNLPFAFWQEIMDTLGLPGEADSLYLGFPEGRSGKYDTDLPEKLFRKRLTVTLGRGVLLDDPAVFSYLPKDSPNGYAKLAICVESDFRETEQ